jgi:hypothetical protein
MVQAEDIFPDKTRRRMVMAAALVCHHRVTPSVVELSPVHASQTLLDTPQG